MTFEFTPGFTLGVAMMTISKLAGRLGVRTDTVRYYEKIGLLPRPERTPSGYRVYDDESVDRLRFIKGSQRLGLTLEEIKDLLSVRDTGLCPCGHTATLLRKRIDSVDEELIRLTALRSELARMVEVWPEEGGCVQEGNRRWHCADELMQIQGLADWVAPETSPSKAGGPANGHSG
ncbi:MAG: heavy metal-responsive transcriptional regulator [Actinomycetota bacterium]